MHRWEVKAGVIVGLVAGQGSGYVYARVCTSAFMHVKSIEKDAVEGEGHQSRGPGGMLVGKLEVRVRPAWLCTASNRSSRLQTQGMFSAQTAPGFKLKLREGQGGCLESPRELGMEEPVAWPWGSWDGPVGLTSRVKAAFGTHPHRP